MRKALVFLLMLQLSTTGIIACDVCSCSSGGSYYGILPQFRKNFIGLRWTGNSSLASQIPSYVTDQVHMPPSRVSLNSIELWGRFYVTKRIQVFAFVPVNMLTEKGGHVTATNYGLGDASVMANYTLVNTGDSLMKKLKHTILLGGGVKLPTGKFRNFDDGSAANPNMQLGTGSVDFILNAVHTMRYKKAGLNTEASYRISTTNHDHYRFGNRLNISVKGFLWLKAGQVSFLPNTGIVVEHAAKNTRNNYEKYYTGGSAAYAALGMETYFKSFNLGFSVQQPVAYNLAEGLIKPAQRITANLTFMF